MNIFSPYLVLLAINIYIWHKINSFIFDRELSDGGPIDMNFHKYLFVFFKNGFEFRADGGFLLKSLHSFSESNVEKCEVLNSNWVSVT